MKNNKARIVLSVVIFITLAIIQLYAFTPYTETETYISSQNVPHTVVAGRGWDDIEDIGYTRYIEEQSLIERERINYFMVALQLLLTACISVFVCFGSKIKIRKVTDKIKEPITDYPVFPDIDINGLAFADEETQNQAKKKYAEDMYRYVEYIIQHSSSNNGYFDEASAATRDMVENEQVSLDDVTPAKPPYMDLNDLAFADEETARQMQAQYAEDLYRYIKDRINTSQ